jgi:ketosteroid isomerase-like protein
MSQENVELVRRGYEAFERGEMEAVLSLLDPDAEIRVDRAFPDWEPFYGPDGFMSFLQMWLEPWETYRVQVDKLIDAGERVLVAATEFGRRRDTGFDVEQRSYHVWTLKDGRAVRLDTFFEWSEALEAAGLDPDSIALSKPEVSG